MAHIQRFTRRFTHNHRHTLLKTGSYYLMHMVVAAGVAYAVTGSFWTAVTLSLLEPTVQAVAYFFHEKAWARREQQVQPRTHSALRGATLDVGTALK